MASSRAVLVTIGQVGRVLAKICCLMESQTKLDTNRPLQS